MSTPGPFGRLAAELASSGSLIVKFKRENLNILSGKLEALSPLGILNRGYSITTKEESGKILRLANAVEKESLIRTKLARGEIVSKVKEVVWPS